MADRNRSRPGKKDNNVPMEAAIGQFLGAAMTGCGEQCRAQNKRADRLTTETISLGRGSDGLPR